MSYQVLSSMTTDLASNSMDWKFLCIPLSLYWSLKILSQRPVKEYSKILANKFLKNLIQPIFISYVNVYFTHFA